MAEYTTVARVGEIAPGQGRQFAFGRKLISVWLVDDTYYAIDDICSHEEYYLSDGELVDTCCVECAAHGAQFDLRTGTALCLPATEPVKTFPVRVVGDEIQVEL
jgi:3-phenylpropionate/trans-cinnamate dioxygenase ferredoxin subunit